MAVTRLDKLLADSGLVSRSEAKSLVRSGRVTVNGTVPRSADEKFEAETTVICIDGEVISCAAMRYLMMNKPAGVLSATEDPRQETVLDLLSPPLKRQGLFPVGRLDKDTTGLLLLCNDGDFAHRVITPKKHVPKVYRAGLDKPLETTDVAVFEHGIVLSDGTKCMPAQLEIIRPCVGRVTVYEGKYHQVKRMFAACGKHVTSLHRESIGDLKLDPLLKPGEYRELSCEELKLVLQNP